MFRQNGVLSTLATTNPDPIPVLYDRGKGVLSISTIRIDNGQGVVGLVNLQATVQSLPPKARAGGNQTVACAHGGAEVLLDGSGSSDPDFDIVHYVWHRGFGWSSADVVSNDIIAPVFAPLGTTPFTLSVIDSHLRISRDTATVTVVDSAPPALTVGAPSPACLWAPNHKYVLFELGTDLPFQVTDTCDGSPVVAISGAVSSQPPTGGGQGSSGPDVVFGPGAVCLRAERQGTSQAGRDYTITVAARDSSGNQTQSNVSVHVNHDQSDHNCPKVAASRIVDANDPRCVEGQ